MTGCHGDELFQCPVCLEDMTSRRPRALTCLHTFCESCLIDLRSGPSKGVIRCPSCRKDTPVPKEGVHKLPENFILKACEDFVKDIFDNKALCQICKLDNTHVGADSFCVPCKCYLCKGCCTNHNEHPLLVTHQLISVERYHKRELCPDHKLHVTYYCATCDETLCTLCVSSKNHDSHMEQVTEQRTEQSEKCKKTNALREIVTQKHKVSLATQVLRNFVGHIYNCLDEMKTSFAELGYNDCPKEVNKKLQKVLSCSVDKYLRLKCNFDSDLEDFADNHSLAQDALYETLGDGLDEYSHIEDGLHKELQVCKLLGLKKFDITVGLKKRLDYIEAETAQEKVDTKFDNILEEIVKQHNDMDAELQTRLIKYEQDCKNIFKEMEQKLVSIAVEAERKYRKKSKGSSLVESNMEENQQTKTANEDSASICPDMFSPLIFYCTISIIFAILLYSFIQSDFVQIIIKVLQEPFRRRNVTLSEFTFGFLYFMCDCGVVAMFLVMVFGIFLLVTNNGIGTNKVYGMRSPILAPRWR